MTILAQDQERAATAPRTRSWPKLAAAAAIVIAGVVVARQLGAFELLSLENIDRLDAWFRGFGIWAPVIFLLVWIASCVFFMPGLPVTIVGALIFGPVKGTALSAVGSVLGATAAFLVGRYAARGTVEGLLANNPKLRLIDDGVKTHGWRMLMITRLVPLFPFNAQNYVYGVTQISLPTYMIVSFLCMLPACVAFNFAAGSIRAGEFGRFFLYLGVAALVFVVLSFIPTLIKRRYANAAALRER